MTQIFCSLLTVAKYFPYILQSIKKNPKSRVPKPKTKLRKQIIGQEIRKHKDLRFVKRKKKKNPIWKLFPGKEERKEQTQKECSC